MYPIYLYLLKNEKPLVVPVIVPLTSLDTTVGYHFNLFMQLYLSGSALLGVIGIEIITMMIVNNIYAGVSLIECEFEKLDALIATDKESKLNVYNIFRNILMQIQDLDK